MSKLLLLQVQDGFISLRGSPSELWKAYILKFLDSFSYFSFSLIFTLFVSADFGYTDVQAGTLYGAWGALITIFGLFTGFIVDNIGVAASLRIGFAISLLSRILIFYTTTRSVLLINVLVILPLGNCLGIPVLATGIRRYTTEFNRGFAFGLFYVIMNVAALLSGPIVDYCTILYDKDENENVNEWKLTGYRAVVLTGIAANVIACLVTFSVREIKLDDGQQHHIPGISNEDMSVGTGVTTTAAKQNSTATAATVSTFIPNQASPKQILIETIRNKNFWRFIVVCLITLNVRMIFRHLDATLPKYMIREFGDNVPKGTIYSINPALIIILVPLISAATTKIDPLLMIHHGSYVSAASVFFLVISTSIWSCVLFVIVLSIGEAVWSPRLYDYTMSVVEEGREGTYMALSSAPLFLAKLPVGFLSGILLQRFCPAEGERHSKTMWLIIGLLTASSPVMLTIFWNYVSHRSKDEAPYQSVQDCNPTGDNNSSNNEDEDDTSRWPALKTELSLPPIHRRDHHTMNVNNEGQMA